MASIGIIMGSVRAGRICPQVASWVKDLAADQDVEIVDLAAWPLPMDDEPGFPVAGV